MDFNTMFSIVFSIECVKRNVILYFNNSGLKLELFLIDPFRKTLGIRFYCPICLLGLCST